jgi:O-methyltransferase
VRLLHLYYNLHIAFRANGAVVEVGCNQGDTAAFLGVILEEFKQQDRELVLFDSFAGLPRWTEGDEGTMPEIASPGMLPATPFDVQDAFDYQKCGIKPRIVPGWFQDTLKDGLPEKIAFAHLDGDLYDSIKVSLEHCYHRMTPGSVIVIDDYNLTGIPGCKRAADEFFRDKPQRIEALPASVSAVVYI